MKRRHLLRLRDTDLQMAARDDIGRPVHDSTGRLIGRVDDFLIEERTVEEAVDQGDGPSSWAARPLYAVVRLRPRRFRPARLVYLPASALHHLSPELGADVRLDVLERSLKQGWFEEWWAAQIPL